MSWGIGKDLKHRVNPAAVTPEKVHKKTYPIPADIVRPSARTMEPVYTDGEFLYRVAPFSFKDNQVGYMMACVSFMYYGIAVYDKNTGRLLKSLYSHTDKGDVQSVFSKYIDKAGCTKIDDPYVLYDLRIKHGYLY